MHAGELWQEYDFNGNRLGGIPSHDFEPGSVKLFGCAAVMLYRFHEGRVEFLFQRRSKFVDRNAEKWDASASGHINFEEAVLDAACREAKEEIGVKVAPSRLEFGATYVYQGALLINLYFCDWTGQVGTFHFDDREVSEVKWIPFDRLVAFWPQLKPSLQDDAVFQHLLLAWAKLAQQKYTLNKKSK